MNREHAPEAWAQFQNHVGGLSRPTSEEQYEQIIALMHCIVSLTTTALPVNRTLHCSTTWLDLLDWEVENEPDLKNSDVQPHKVLAYLMSEHGISQYQPAQENIVYPGNLRRIFAGERSISANLAKKLADRFRHGLAALTVD